MFKSANEIGTALLEAGLPVVDAQRLAQWAKPAVWLATRPVDDEAEIAIGTTKLGGRPDLPASAAWPVRDAYPGAANLWKGYREALARPDVRWGWATPEQRTEFVAETVERMKRIESAFPLTFVAQVNFAEMWAAGPLDSDIPASGIMSVFYDLTEQPSGFDPHERFGFSILFHEVAQGPLTRRDPPSAIRALPPDYQLDPLACQPAACFTPLPISTAQFRELNLSDESTDLLHDWWCNDDHLYSSQDGVDWRCHHVGGWPNPIQGTCMQIESALVNAGHNCGNTAAYQAPELAPVRTEAAAWLLLAQIGSDEPGNLVWGDSGQLYVWIRRPDLVARRFDQAHLILQYY